MEIETEIDIEMGWSGKKSNKTRQGPVRLLRSIIMVILHILCQRHPPHRPPLDLNTDFGTLVYLSTRFYKPQVQHVPEYFLGNPYLGPPSQYSIDAQIVCQTLLMSISENGRNKRQCKKFLYCHVIPSTLLFRQFVAQKSLLSLFA